MEKIHGEGSSATLTKFNNMHNWCNYHKEWVTHTNEKCKVKNNVSPRQAVPRFPVTAVVPEQPATDAAPAPVSYTVTFETTVTVIHEEQGTPP